jgi:hypothetical protein
MKGRGGYIAIILQTVFATAAFSSPVAQNKGTPVDGGIVSVLDTATGSGEQSTPEAAPLQGQDTSQSAKKADTTPAPASAVIVFRQRESQPGGEYAPCQGH